ncbi:MAG TPA: ATP-binding protein, partial [Pseudolabrys sp.]
GRRFDSPWLRAAMLTPSMSDYMTATRLGALDPRPLHELLYKPSLSLAMTFSADPHLGMVADRFSGSAVVFLATTTFSIQTASLR